MADNKKSFILYCDIIHTIEKLPDKEKGKLFQLILDYVNDKDPDESKFSLIIQIAFEPIKRQLKRDLQKYESIKEIRKEVGKLGGRPKTKQNQSKPIGLNKNQSKAKKPVTVNDTVNVNVNDTDSGIEINLPINNYSDDIINQFTDLENAAKSKDTTVEEIEKLIPKFIIDSKGRKKTYSGMDDVMSHFYSWVKYQEIKSNTNNKPYIDPFDKIRLEQKQKENETKQR